MGTELISNSHTSWKVCPNRRPAPLLIYDTVRHLRCQQIVSQFLMRIRSKVEKCDVKALGVTPELTGCEWPNGGIFLAPPENGNSKRDLLDGKMCFLNSEHPIGWPPQWNREGLPKLWQYNLHYFDWLWLLEFQDARGVVLDWITRHPLRRGAVGWDPYPISLRLMNWCGLLWGIYRDQVAGDPEFENVVWQSIYCQAEWLRNHLETHLLGNHLFENAAALAFVGSCFRGEAPRQWLSTGLDLLRQEIQEQVLKDGMHFELSPMYHLRVLYVLDLLASTGNSRIEELVSAPLCLMRKALAKCCHPDGQIALLNDSAFGIYHKPEVLQGGKLEKAQNSAWEMPHAGYYGWRDTEGNYLICDAGPVGPDYIPGHAHADIFSFELSLRGYRVIVDAGVHDYVAGEMRRYCRSTRAHNTIEIDGLDLCECWGVFRVARRGRPRGVCFTPAPDGFTLSAWHDGYHRLKGRPTHHRTFQWRLGAGLCIQDRVTASRPVQAVSRLHMHPDCRIIDVDAGQVRVEYPGGQFLIEYASHYQLRLEESLYCPEFGRRIKNASVCLLATGRDITIETLIKV